MKLLIQVFEEDGKLGADVLYNNDAMRVIAIRNVNMCAAGDDPAHFSLWEFDSETGSWTKLAPLEAEMAAPEEVLAKADHDIHGRICSEDCPHCKRAGKAYVQVLGEAGYQIVVAADD